MEEPKIIKKVSTITKDQTQSGTTASNTNASSAQEETKVSPEINITFWSIVINLLQYFQV